MRCIGGFVKLGEFMLEPYRLEIRPMGGMATVFVFKNEGKDPVAAWDGEQDSDMFRRIAELAILTSPGMLNWLGLDRDEKFTSGLKTRFGDLIVDMELIAKQQEQAQRAKTMARAQRH
jgi:hypothetical protein